jgi:UDP-N-acetylmuramate dehydrogenase
MAQKNIVTPGKKRLIGMGFNTWRSDLKNLDEYVKSDSPCGASGATVLDKAPFMAGIPGTIGGWIKMNAGAFGHSISEVISRVKVDGEWLENSECGFGYRTSKINGEIQDVEWTTPKSDLEILSASEYLARRKKFPEGTYGSFFKNPPGDYAGRLLEEADLKGFRVGGAYVWEEHANVIVRGEGAIMSDVLALAKIMHDKVKSLFGVDLEPEVCGITL